MTKLYTLLIVLCFAGFASIPASADDGKMTIGSKAPNLDIEHWINDGEGEFEHTTELKSGRVYVIEFWATWCGPCIRAMPEISKLQQEFRKQNVQIISVSDEPLETVNQFVEREVRGEEELTYGDLTSNYCLTTDPDGSVFKDYFLAAGRTGIPCAFIVGKTGQIEWIGHPAQMKQPLEDVVNDNWDRETFAVAYKAKQEAAEKRRKLQQTLMVAVRKIQADMESKDFDSAVEKIDALLDDEDFEPFQSNLQSMKNEILILHIGGDKAVEALSSFVEENRNNAMVLNQIAWGIYEKHSKEGGVDEAILKGAQAAAEAAAKAAPNNGAVLDTLSHLVYANGDVRRALEIQEKAVKNANGMEAELKPFLEKLRKEVEESDK